MQIMQQKKLFHISRMLSEKVKKEKKKPIQLKFHSFSDYFECWENCFLSFFSVHSCTQSGSNNSSKNSSLVVRVLVQQIK